MRFKKLIAYQKAFSLAWLEFAYALEYINGAMYDKLIDQNEEVGKLINHMIDNPEKFLELHLIH